MPGLRVLVRTRAGLRVLARTPDRDEAIHLAARPCCRADSAGPPVPATEPRTD